MTSELKTPEEWAAEMGATILDPDGWRRPNDPPFDQPCTREEFLPRFYISTISMPTRGRGAV